MTFYALVLIGISLSMDAFAIAVSNGIAYQGGKKQICLTAMAFGIAQAIMPVLGFLLGSTVSRYLTAVDHWVAFTLLLLVGGKMLVDGGKGLKQPEKESEPGLSGWLLCTQAIATSIDALAVGISFAALRVAIIPASAIIGTTTFLLCLLGGSVGKRLGKVLQHYALLVGGLVLIGLGTKILLEHLGAM